MKVLFVRSHRMPRSGVFRKKPAVMSPGALWDRAALLPGPRCGGGPRGGESQVEEVGCFQTFHLWDEEDMRGTWQPGLRSGTRLLSPSALGVVPPLPSTEDPPMKHGTEKHHGDSAPLEGRGSQRSKETGDRGLVSHTQCQLVLTPTLSHRGHW